jgi:hypothetical protein
MMQTSPSSGTAEIKKPATTAVRCKVCGYITDAAHVTDLCPACGVKAAMFEPLAENFSDSRRKFLEMHLHPVIVHFPQAFAGTLLALALVMLALPETGALRQVLGHAALVLSIALPVTVIASFISGIADARVRFKKTSTPYLRIKIITGVVYIVLSAVMAMIVFITRLAGFPAAVIAAAVAMELVVSTTILGKIGSSIACSRMPG